jgi:hypothetical protein
MTVRPVGPHGQLPGHGEVAFLRDLVTLVEGVIAKADSQE